jgi:hypothetical protein
MRFHVIPVFGPQFAPMRFAFLAACLFLFGLNSGFGQELGHVSNEDHYIKLVKSEYTYSLVYSTIASNAEPEKHFIFSNLKSVYDIIFNGFEKKNNHQVIVRTTSDTIIKFDFRKVRGTNLLMIQQNDLADNSFGSSSFFTKADFEELFNSTP